jgi:hypothetical protein
MGTGLGLTTAPATESILSVLPPARAGVGSAINDATRQAGGTLGVAVIGSVYTSLYTAGLTHGATAHLPAAALHAAQRSVGAGYLVAQHAPGILREPLLHQVSTSFMSGLHAGCIVAAGVCLVGAAAASALPGRRSLGASTHALVPTPA